MSVSTRASYPRAQGSVKVYVMEESQLRRSEERAEISQLLGSKGSVRARADNGPAAYGQAVARLGAGQTFGELAVIKGGGTRQATVAALAPTQLLVITKAAYEAALSAAHQGDMRQRVRFLRGLSFLRHCDDEKIAALSQAMVAVEYPRDAIIFCQGQRLDHVYLIAEGRCRAVLAVAPPEKLAAASPEAAAAPTATATASSAPEASRVPAREALRTAPRSAPVDVFEMCELFPGCVLANPRVFANRGDVVSPQAEWTLVAVSNCVRCLLLNRHDAGRLLSDEDTAARIVRHITGQGMLPVPTWAEIQESLRQEASWAKYRADVVSPRAPAKESAMPCASTAHSWARQRVDEA